MSGYAFAVLTQEGAYVWAALPGVLLLILSIAEFVVADLLVDARFPKETSEFLERLRSRLSKTSTHDEIVGALERCVRHFQGCDLSRISATLQFRIETYDADDTGRAPGLVQLSDYTRQGGRRWRVVQPTKGIVGRCLRTESEVWVNFSTEQEYRRRMVEEFGFTHEETDQHTTTARSYLAYPVRSKGTVVAIMFFFSTEPQVFPLATDEDELNDTADEIAGLLRAAEIL